MTTDKTPATLATVKHGGCVQLGDGLPPLPYPNYPVSKTGLQNNAYTASQMTDYARAALSAQPSPGGQGDAVGIEAIEAARSAYKAARVWSTGIDRDGNHIRSIADLNRNDDAAWAAALTAALAASQPVRIYGCCAQPEGQLHTDDCPNLRHLAARQPVGEPVDSYESSFQEVEPPPLVVNAAGFRALESFLTVAEEFRRSTEPYIEAINEGGSAGDDEISEVFDRHLNYAKTAVSRSTVYTAPTAQAVDLATDHCGMRIDYHGLLRQVQRGLRLDPALAEMVRQLHGHLTELGKRWYAGDRKVVDELLQLYGIEEGARRALIDSQAVGNG